MILDLLSGYSQTGSGYQLPDVANLGSKSDYWLAVERASMQSVRVDDNSCQVLGEETGRRTSEHVG